MAGGPVVLLGQGEQYEDPDDWRELMRARRIRRGVEVAVRRDGLTSWVRPEDAPELAAVLDQVDPPGPPAGVVPVTPARLGAAPLPGAGTAVPAAGGATTPEEAAPTAPGTPAGQPRAVPRASPRRRWRFGFWRWVVALGALLLVRFCAQDGIGPLPSFGDRPRPAASSSAAHGSARSGVCAGGWIARAACQDASFARLRPALMRAYDARLDGLDAGGRNTLAAEQARWQAGRVRCRRAAAPGACLAGLYRRRIAALQGGDAPAATPATDAPPPAEAPDADRADHASDSGAPATS